MAPHRARVAVGVGVNTDGFPHPRCPHPEHAQKKGCQQKADRAVWDKVTKGASWNKVGWRSRKAWKDLGGNREEILPIDKFGGYTTKVKERIEVRERLALRNKVRGDTSRDV